MSDPDPKVNPYACIVCDERFSEKAVLEKHYFTHVKSNGVISCNVCQRFHHRSRKDCKCFVMKKFTCKSCGIHFTLKEDFHRHYKMHEKKIYACNICDKTYKVAKSLTFHQFAHFNTRPYACTFCDKAFNTPTTLRNHVFIHSAEKLFVCEICNRQFRLKKTLKCHYLTHTREKPYMCEICHRRFSRVGSLKTHYRTHRKMKVEAVSM